MAEQISLAQLKVILERYRLNTPRVQKAIAKRVAALVANQATSNVNDDLLMKRTGGLMRYIGSNLRQIREQENSITIGLPKGEKLAIVGRMQDEGGTIHAKNWFTKPSAKNPSGTGPWLIFPRAGGDWWTKAGVVSQAFGVQVGFAMVKQVTLKARYWFRGAVEFARQNQGREANVVMQKFLANHGEAPDAV
jgi:hypothetical protein